MLLDSGPQALIYCSNYIRYSLLTLGLWAQSHTFASVLTAASANTIKISKFVALCRVEP